MRERLGQLLRYAATAGAAAIVDVAGFVWLRSVGWPVEVAAAASFLVATLVNYRLTAWFVFHAPISGRGYLRFLGAASVGFVLNVGLTVLGERVFHLPPAAAKILAVGIAFFANFLLNALFVFKPRNGNGL